MAAGRGPEFAISRGQEENMGLHQPQQDHSVPQLFGSKLLDLWTLSGRFPEVLGPWTRPRRWGGRVVIKVTNWSNASVISV